MNKDNLPIKDDGSKAYELLEELASKLILDDVIMLLGIKVEEEFKNSESEEGKITTVISDEDSDYQIDITMERHHKDNSTVVSRKAERVADTFCCRFDME